MAKFDTISFPLKDRRLLLRSLPLELRSMLPEIGSKEWIGVARSLRCNVISGRGGVGKRMTLTLDIPISGTPRATASSSLPTKQEEKEQTTGPYDWIQYNA